MKTMTCRQLGGVCDLEHQGEAPDDVIKAQDRHLKGGGEGRRRRPPASARGDEEPVAASEEVDGLVPRHEDEVRVAP